MNGTKLSPEPEILMSPVATIVTFPATSDPEICTPQGTT